MERKKKKLKEVKNVTLRYCRSQLLPAMGKALLRSPEIALLTVSHILSDHLDLSAFATDLGKSFATNLKSKDDATREDATKAILGKGGSFLAKRLVFLVEFTYINLWCFLYKICS